MGARISAGLLLVFFAACATARTTEFRTSGVGSISLAMDCIEDAVENEGYQITSDPDGGILNARSGANEVSVRVSGGDANSYGIVITTSDTEPARDVAREIVADCGA